MDNATCLEAASLDYGGEQQRGCTNPYDGKFTPWTDELILEDNADRPEGCYSWGGCQGGCGLSINSYAKGSNTTCGDCWGGAVYCKRKEEDGKKPSEFDPNSHGTIKVASSARPRCTLAPGADDFFRDSCSRHSDDPFMCAGLFHHSDRGCDSFCCWNAKSEKAWLLDGCPKVGVRKLDQEVDEHQVAPVRCCSDSTASCHSKDIGCVKQTYSDAKRTCANHGMRLCSWQEMKSNFCCGTGCNFDLELAWISRHTYPHNALETVSEANVTVLV